MNAHRDDSSADEVWRAFVEADACLHAPPDLEARVLETVAVSQPLERSRRARRMIRASALAAMMLLTVMLFIRHQPSGDGPRSSQAADSHGGSQAPVASAGPAVVPRLLAAPAHGAARRVTRTRAPAPREPLPPVLMTLGASPVRDTEALQLVRVRLPREALQGLGVVLLEPDAAGIVDVDVLIGEDGLARDIRQVRTGAEQQEMPR